MPTPIQPCGAFFPKTADGYIQNPCSEKLIDPRYWPILNEIKAAYISQEGSNLHSIYLRGSVPRGMAVGNCDLDTFALVFSENDRWTVPTWAAKIQGSLNDKYLFLTNAEIYRASYTQVLNAISGNKFPEGTATNPNLAMMVKTQSLCLYGDDISAQIPSYLPDERMMLNYRWLKEDIAAFAENKKDIEERQQLLKTFLRSGFELVMPKLKQYTPDLYLCYNSFAHYYPEQENLMKKALCAYLNPKETSEAEVDRIVERLGDFLVKGFEK